MFTLDTADFKLPTAFYTNIGCFPNVNARERMRMVSDPLPKAFVATKPDNDLIAFQNIFVSML